MLYTLLHYFKWRPIPHPDLIVKFLSFSMKTHNGRIKIVNKAVSDTHPPLGRAQWLFWKQPGCVVMCANSFLSKCSSQLVLQAEIYNHSVLLSQLTDRKNRSTPACESHAQTYRCVWICDNDNTCFKGVAYFFSSFLLTYKPVEMRGRIDMQFFFLCLGVSEANNSKCLVFIFKLGIFFFFFGCVDFGELATQNNTKV